MPPPAAAARTTTIKPIFMPRDMWLPQLTKGATDRGLERRDRFVVVIDRVHVITFGTLHGVLGIRDLEGSAGAQPVAVLRQPQLIARGLPIGRLDADRLIGRLEPQPAGMDVASHLEPPSALVLVRIRLLRAGL